MYRTLSISLLVVAGLLLGGCAGTARNGVVREQVPQDDGVDYQKIVSVNRWARERGHVVQWINLPEKSRDDKLASH